jgi:CheY-like chemotaxis protein
VDIANNGLEAIERLKTNDYPLILLDIEMPVLGNSNFDLFKTPKIENKEFGASTTKEYGLIIP